MLEKQIFKQLEQLYEETPPMEISSNDRIVIFSDLHLGDGSSGDDFAHNGEFFRYIIENHYLAGNYQLLLNGDIEELHKFSMKKIVMRWKKIYRLLERFQRKNKLIRTLGNHDYTLKDRKKALFGTLLRDACKLRWNNNDLFIFHGHQAGFHNSIVHWVARFSIRYIGNPLGIKNYSVAFNSRKKYRVERRVYDFARKKKILAIIGHTHRPLFDSLSRIDSLKFKIEKYCRIYPTAKEPKKSDLAEKIKRYKEELQPLLAKEKNPRQRNSLYGMDPVVPCIFNSGCCIGKNGITAIEINNGSIQLVYWFDRRRTEKYFDFNGYIPKQLGTSDFWHVTIKKETLDYVFSRIKLLA
jgi:UDP-2,3-diacylglucosamine pyrophosphatase LpxH